MNNQITLKKIIHFTLTKMIIGVLVVGGSVALVEWLRKSFLDNIQLAYELKDFIIAIIDVFVALFSYRLLFRFYEKRLITELSLAGFWKKSILGFTTGMILQSSAIFVIYLSGGYTILRVNPISFLVPGFTAALIAGFVAEILIRGIFFRLMEEKLGTAIAILISALLFGILHSRSKDATILSVLSTVIQAGILLSAVFVLTRSLWLPIFLHFAWDFAEPGIYGGVNPGLSIEKTLFTSKIAGSELLTGGPFGPGNSIQAALFCLIVSLSLLWFAKRNDKFKKPFWKK